MALWQTGDVVGPTNLNAKSGVGGFFSQTLSAALFGSSSNSTEFRIQAAINSAVTSGIRYVLVPANFLPYNASQITFNNAVKMLREGGDPLVHDPQAFGAAGNAVIVSRAVAGSFASITGQDDTAALAACIQSAAANLEVVVLPPNAFKITSALTLPTNTQLTGSGWNSQICPNWFDASGSSSGGQAAIMNADQNNGNANISISNFYINSAGSTITPSNLANGAAAGIFLRGTSLGLGGCQDIAIKNMKLTNTPGISIAFQGCQRVQIVGNLIHDVGKDGITGSWFSGANLTDVLVEGNTIFNPGDDGIAVLGSISNQPNTLARPTRIAIVGNTVRDISGTSGAGRGIIVLGCQDTVVTGNVVHNTFSDGIAVTWDSQVPGGSYFSSQRVAITGNVVQDAGQQGDGSQPQNGVRITGVGQVTLTGNVVDRAKTSGILITDNSTVSGACSDVIIANNTVTSCGSAIAADFAVYVSEGVANNISRVAIVGNTIGNNWSAGLRVQGGSPVRVVDNSIFNNGIGQTSTIDVNGSGVMLGNFSSANTITLQGNLITDTRSSGTRQTYGVTLYSVATPVAALHAQNNLLTGNTNSGVNIVTAPTIFDGSASLPPYALTSESSLGWYRSAASTMALSYGSFVVQMPTAVDRVGFGTLTPSFRMQQVFVSVATFTNATGDFAMMWTNNGPGSGNVFGISAQTVTPTTFLVTNQSYDLAFALNGSEKARLRVADGNLAITQSYLGPANTALRPTFAFSSESSLGWYRSAVSTMALSYGGLGIKAGTNASCGTAVLGSNGSVNVATTYVQTGDLIFLTDQTPSGTLGDIEVGGIRNGSGFTIQSTSLTDTSTVAWLIVRPT